MRKLNTQVVYPGSNPGCLVQHLLSSIALYVQKYVRSYYLP